MASAPTLVCKITTGSNVKANLSSNGSISAEFSLPTQVEAEHYAGSYEYTPTFHEQVLPTANKLLDSDLHFHSIQTYETSNEYGTTFII